MESKVKLKLEELKVQKATQENIYAQLSQSLRTTELNIVSLSGAIQALTELLKEPELTNN
jgi:uncharacterized coiled-coil protein SlyX